MARGVNKVILIGNLGQDPVVKYTQSGAAVANISIATSESWKDKQTGEQQERTEWHRVVMFNRLGEIAGEYLRKGSRVYIEGKLQTRSWEQDGQTKYITEIVAREMQMLSGKGESGQPPAAQPQPQKQHSNQRPQQQQEFHPSPPLGEYEHYDDDIPF